MANRMKNLILSIIFLSFSILLQPIDLLSDEKSPENVLNGIDDLGDDLYYFDFCREFTVDRCRRKVRKK